MDNGKLPEQPTNNNPVAPESPQIIGQTPILGNNELVSSSEHKNRKKLFFLILFVFLLLASATTWYLLSSNDTAVQKKTIAPTRIVSKPTFKRTVVYVDLFEVKSYNPATKKLETLYSPSKTEEKYLCRGSEGCSGPRFIDVTKDYSKVALDLLMPIKKSKDVEAQYDVGYYDRQTKKTVHVAKGYQPIWSPSGSKLAYTDNHGIEIYNLATGLSKNIKGTQGSFSSNAEDSYILGWKSDSELIVDKNPLEEDNTYSIANLISGKMVDYAVTGIDEQQNVLSYLTYQDGSKMLLRIGSNEIGSVNYDGTDYQQVVSLENPDTEFGSGYQYVTFSHDEDKFLIFNNYNPDITSGTILEDNAETYSLNGDKQLSTRVKDTFDDQFGCWYDDNRVYVLYDPDGEALSPLGELNLSTGKITKISDAHNISTIICP